MLLYSDTECERRMEERKKDETRANIYKVEIISVFPQDLHRYSFLPSFIKYRHYIFVVISIINIVNLNYNI